MFSCKTLWPLKRLIPSIWEIVETIKNSGRKSEVGKRNLKYIIKFKLLVLFINWTLQLSVGLSFTDFIFDISTSEFYWPLIGGHRSRDLNTFHSPKYLPN